MSRKRLDHWLSGGTERCEHCAQAYVYEMEHRCLACDGPVCPLCARITGGVGVHCPACGADAAERTS